MVVVDFGGRRATIQGNRWSSDDKGLQAMLNSGLDPMGPEGSDPYPDLTAAREAAEDYGGKIIKQDAPPKVEKGLIY